MEENREKKAARFDGISYHPRPTHTIPKCFSFTKRKRKKAKKDEALRRMRKLAQQKKETNQPKYLTCVLISSGWG